MGKDGLRRRLRVCAALLVVGLVSGCGRVVPAETAAQAIAVGEAACDRAWGELYEPYGVRFRNLHWHATFFNGDRWRVWVDGANKSQLEVIVYTSGEAPSACAMYGKFAV
jgi:hypothetical protein